MGQIESFTLCYMLPATCYSSLPLIVLGVLADHTDDPFAANNLALFTALFNRWFDFHDKNSCAISPDV
jgi:hypothetical protein